jgi:hypothetical protein
MVVTVSPLFNSFWRDCVVVFRFFMIGYLLVCLHLHSCIFVYSCTYNLLFYGVLYCPPSSYEHFLHFHIIMGPRIILWIIILQISL